MTLVERFQAALKPETVYAHCDVPCGIYNPTPALIAAQTVHKMVTKMQELQRPGADAPQDAVRAYVNSIGRMVATKEEHAQLCKKELLILWTDYFKPEHLSMFPNLHETFWKAAKLCSKNKQEVNLDAAQQLVDAVKAIGQMFDKAEAAKAKK